MRGHVLKMTIRALLQQLLNDFKEAEANSEPFEASSSRYVDLLCPLCRIFQLSSKHWIKHVKHHLEDLVSHRLIEQLSAVEIEEGEEPELPAGRASSAEDGAGANQTTTARNEDADDVLSEHLKEPSQDWRRGTRLRHPPSHSASEYMRKGKLQPVGYSRVHRRFLDYETLRYYDIPYDYDRNDLGYFILLRDFDKYEIDVLFEHSRRLRAPLPTYPKVHIKYLSEESLKHFHLPFEVYKGDPNYFVIFLAMSDETQQELDAVFEHTKRLLNNGSYSPRECKTSGCGRWFGNDTDLERHYGESGHDLDGESARNSKTEDAAESDAPEPLEMKYRVEEHNPSDELREVSESSNSNVPEIVVSSERLHPIDTIQEEEED